MIEESLFQQIIACMPIISIDLILKNNKDEVLLIKREKYPAKTFWTPGGRIFYCEQIDNAVKRLLQTEVGLQCLEFKHIGFINPIFGKEGDMVCVKHTPSLIVSVIEYDGEITLDSNHSDYKWVKYNSKKFNIYLREILEKAGLEYGEE